MTQRLRRSKSAALDRLVEISHVNRHFALFFVARFKTLLGKRFTLFADWFGGRRGRVWATSGARGSCRVDYVESASTGNGELTLDVVVG